MMSRLTPFMSTTTPKEASRFYHCPVSETGGVPLLTLIPAFKNAKELDHSRRSLPLIRHQLDNLSDLAESGNAGK